MSGDLTESIEQYHLLMSEGKYDEGNIFAQDYDIPIEELAKEYRRIKKEFKKKPSTIKRYEKSIPNSDMQLIEMMNDGAGTI